MNHEEFERFVLWFGKDILRFCRMTAGDTEAGDELYQDTMLKLLEKQATLDLGQNTKSYALSIAIFLWKNRKKKYAVRQRLVPTKSIEEITDDAYLVKEGELTETPEGIALKQDDTERIQGIVAALPEKYRLPIYLYYSADLKVSEIAKVLHETEGTVKSRMRKAKRILKEKLEALGYDG